MVVYVTAKTYVLEGHCGPQPNSPGMDFNKLCTTNSDFNFNKDFGKYKIIICVNLHFQGTQRILVFDTTCAVHLQSTTYPTKNCYVNQLNC